jgi:hypothetical protein
LFRNAAYGPNISAFEVLPLINHYSRLIMYMLALTAILKTSAYEFCSYHYHKDNLHSGEASISLADLEDLQAKEVCSVPPTYWELEKTLGTSVAGRVPFAINCSFNTMAALVFSLIKVNDVRAFNDGTLLYVISSVTFLDSIGVAVAFLLPRAITEKPLKIIMVVSVNFDPFEIKYLPPLNFYYVKLFESMIFITAIFSIIFL